MERTDGEAVADPLTDSVQLTIRVPRALHERIIARALLEERTVSQEVRRTLHRAYPEPKEESR
jgi:hypothetical protein